MLNDEETLELARRVLETQDGHHLVRLVDARVRRLMAEMANPTPQPARERRGPHGEIPAPRGYTTRPQGETRLTGVLALDNEPLYDRAWLRPREPGEYYFFALPLGAVDMMQPPVTRSEDFVKRRTETNMTNSNRLPEPERFEVTGISMHVRDDVPAAFVTWLRHETYFELRVGGATTPMHREPTWRFVRKVKTAALLEDELYSRVPVMEFPKDLTVLIGLSENFSAVIVNARSFDIEPERVRLQLHGYHAKGVRRG